jgi:hypothetical protein
MTLWLPTGSMQPTSSSHSPPGYQTLASASYVKQQNINGIGRLSCSVHAYNHVLNLLSTQAIDVCRPQATKAGIKNTKTQSRPASDAQFMHLSTRLKNTLIVQAKLKHTNTPRDQSKD